MTFKGAFQLKSFYDPVQGGFCGCCLFGVFSYIPGCMYILLQKYALEISV